MKITNCKINHRIHPVGRMMGKELTFSWVVEEEAARESRILVFRGAGDEGSNSDAGEAECIYDSGFGELNSLGTVAELSLQPRTRYFWVVQARGESGSTAESARQYFETGKMQEAWTGKWITCDMEQGRLPLFIKDFTLEQEASKIREARLYITGLGLYEAYLGECRVGEEYLTPGFHQYRKWVQAQTYDVTEALKEEAGDKEALPFSLPRLSEGMRRLSVLMGEGWYLGRVHYEGPEKNLFGREYKLLAELRIRYEDSTEQVIATDESWRVSRSTLTFSGIYDGEHRDDTLEDLPEEQAIPAQPPEEQVIHAQPQEEQAILAQPPEGEVVDSLNVPAVLQEEFPGEIVYQNPGEVVLDLGQNMAGIFRLHLREKKGTRIRLQVGEVLQDGKFYRDNLRSARAEYLYVSDGNEKWIRPYFTYYGYRYVRIEGAEHFRQGDFVGIAVYADIPAIGQVRTGHEKLNQLFSNVYWGMRGNFLSVPTDCPQRDERMGWTGDTQVFSATACYLADAYAFYERYLHDMRQEQALTGGLVPNIVPTVVEGDRSGCAVWGDAVWIIPWNLYLFTGDAGILRKMYPGVRQWLEYIAFVDGEDHGWRRHGQLGDWLALDSPYGGKSPTRGGTDEGFIADVYYRRGLLTAARMARVLGLPEEAAEWDHRADRVKQGILEEYYSPAGRCCIHTQTAAVLGLKEGLGNRERNAEMLRRLLNYREGKLSTGFVGTAFLNQELMNCGMEEEAFYLLLNEEFPGWLYEVNLGATTIWERWNSLDESGHISSTGMNSLNHYAYGAIEGWFWKDVVGLHPVEEAPGFRKARIAPHMQSEIGHVDAEYDSPSGKYRIFWEVKGDLQVHFRALIPEGCSAVIELPHCREILSYSGTCESIGGDAIVLGEGTGALAERSAAGADGIAAGADEYRGMHSAAHPSWEVSAGLFEITYEADRPLRRIYRMEDRLQVLIQNPDVRRILEEEIPDLDRLLTFVREDSLKAAMKRLGYEAELIGRIDGRIRDLQKQV